LKNQISTLQTQLTAKTTDYDQMLKLEDQVEELEKKVEQMKGKLGK